MHYVKKHRNQKYTCLQMHHACKWLESLRTFHECPDALVVSDFAGYAQLC